MAGTEYWERCEETKQSNVLKLKDNLGVRNSEFGIQPLIEKTSELKKITFRKATKVYGSSNPQSAIRNPKSSDRSLHLRILFQSVTLLYSVELIFVFRRLKSSEYERLNTNCSLTLREETEKNCHERS